MTACGICGWLDRFAAGLPRRTVVVLDNAPVHRSKLFASRRATWEKRGLFVFFLPPYSPELNIAEILWRRLKYGWLKAEDYADRDTLCYQVWQALAAVGKSLNIAFSNFKQMIT